MYRSQLLLQQLGIHQWIPQQQATEKVSVDALWRDQQAEIMPNSVAIVPLVPKVVASAQQLQNIVKEAPQSQPDNIAVPPEPVAITEVEPEYSQDISFDYQVIVHDRFVVFAEVSNEQEQILFNNIRQACHATTLLMQWPLAITTWDMNDYVLQSYLQGVLANHQEKDFIALGDIQLDANQIFDKHLKKYASLQQLLESAEQKKALWQALYPLVYDDESKNA